MLNVHSAEYSDHCRLLQRAGLIRYAKGHTHKARPLQFFTPFELLCIVALHTCPYSRQISSDSKDWAMGDFGALLEAQIPCIRRYAHAQQGMQPAPMILCSVPSSGHTGSNRRGDALPYKCTEPIRKA